MATLKTLLSKAAKIRNFYAGYSPAQIKWAENRNAVGMLGPRDVGVLFETIDALKAENKAPRSKN